MHRIRRRSLCRPHPCSSAHAALVDSYRMARHAWELQAEAYSGGNEEEHRAYAELVPPPTFRSWLLGSRLEVAA